MQKIYDACDSGDCEKLEKILKSDECPKDINTLVFHYKKRSCPLIVSMKKNHVEIVKILLNEPRTDIFAGKWVTYYGGSVYKSCARYAMKLSNSEFTKLFLDHPQMDLNRVSYNAERKTKVIKETVFDTLVSNLTYSKSKILVERDINFLEGFDSGFSRFISYRLKKYIRLIRNGWKLKTHTLFPKRYRQIAWSLFLYDLRIQYIPNELKRLIMCYIPPLIVDNFNSFKKKEEEKKEVIGEGSDDDDVENLDDGTDTSDDDYDSSDDDP